LGEEIEIEVGNPMHNRVTEDESQNYDG
jgi:hypothetical protein